MSLFWLGDDALHDISATSEASNFPVSNLQDRHPKNIWQTDGELTATLTLDVPTPMDVIGIAGTNAESASVTITDPNQVILGGDSSQTPPDTLGASDDTSNVDTNITATATKRARTKVMLIEITPQTTGGVSVELVLSAGDTLYAGVLQVGIFKEFSGPRYGIKESRDDTSISTTLSNGEEYYKKRDTLRVFSLSSVLPRESSTDNDWYDFIDIYDVYGKLPFFWKLTEWSGTQWGVFGKINREPTVTHKYPSYSVLNMQIKEVL